MLDSAIEIVITVSYVGLCIGTFISVSDTGTSLPKRICIAVFAPIPVLLVLVWAATSIAIEKYRTPKDYCDYPMLLALSLAMYVDAVWILTCRHENSSHVTVYRYDIKDYTSKVRSTIVTNYAAA